MIAGKHLLRYLKGSSTIGLTYKGPTGDRSITLTGHADASYNSDPESSRSVGGYVFSLNGVALSWRSKLQDVVALSTTEAEYMALSSAIQEATHLRQLLKDIGLIQGPTVIHQDNQPCIHVSTNPVTHPRTKHIAVKYHYVRECIAAGIIRLVYTPTLDMTADIFTKALGKVLFFKFRAALLGMHP